MSFSIEEIELLKNCVDKGRGLPGFDFRIYEATPVTIKITHKATNSFFVIQNIGKYIMLVKPEHRNLEYTVDKFDDVIARLMQWQVDLI